MALNFVDVRSMQLAYCQGRTLSGQAIIVCSIWDESGDNNNLNDLWLQQDGATCYAAQETAQLLNTTFSGRLSIVSVIDFDKQDHVIL